MGINGKAEVPAQDDALPQGRRKHNRKSVLWAARLETDAGAVDCVAFDLSLGGAKLKVDAPVAMRRPVRLVIARFGVLRAETVWRRAGTVGLRFAEPPETIAAMLSEVLRF